MQIVLMNSNWQQSSPSFSSKKYCTWEGGSSKMLSASTSEGLLGPIHVVLWLGHQLMTKQGHVCMPGRWQVSPRERHIWIAKKAGRAFSHILPRPASLTPKSGHSPSGLFQGGWAAGDCHFRHQGPQIFSLEPGREDRSVAVSKCYVTSLVSHL